MKRSLVGASILVVALAGVCLAAANLVGFKCSKCGLQGQIAVGGTAKFDDKPCFCTKCNRFVSIVWRKGTHAPEPAARVKGVPYYTCPECGKPTAREWDQKSCPKCGSREVRIEILGPVTD